MKVLIISGLAGNGKATPYADYFSESIKNHEFEDLNFDQLAIRISPGRFTITNGRSGSSIADNDLVMVREYDGNYLDVAFVLSRFLDISNVSFFNRNYLNYRPVSKIAQAVMFYQEGLNFPETLFSLDPSLIKDDLERIGYPLILKDTAGMHGSNNFLVESFEELRTIYNEHPGVKFVAQKFIPNDSDYRVLVMGDQPPLQIKRTAAPGSHLNNTSQGGTGMTVNDLPADILEQASRAVKKFNLAIGGVDIMRNQADGAYYFLEMNNQPQLVTGAETDKKMEAFSRFLDSLNRS